MSRIHAYMDVLACIKKLPRTEAELGEVVGLSRKPVRELCRAAYAEGLIEPFGKVRTPEGERGRYGSMVWMWRK